MVLQQPNRFEASLQERGLAPLTRAAVTTLQVNVGKRCNMACLHCHVEAGPERTEVMSAEVADRVLALLARSPGVEVVDLTGGAPELNPQFRRLVRESRRLGKQVLHRSNLTVLLEPGMEDLPRFFVEQQVRLVASLPCYQRETVDSQRGVGAFDKSLEALRRLNALGYGQPGSALTLDLVYNPGGPDLPPPQADLEAEHREELGRRFDLRFHHLLTLTNMPIKRFAQALARSGQTEQYLQLLQDHFNPETVPALMCLALVSVGWDGRLYDCDFNQMLELPLGDGRIRTVFDLEDLGGFAGRPISTASHCLGCTAGAGSSCGGALR